MRPPQHPMLLGLTSSPKYNGSDCSQTQGFWVSHLRGAQSSWA